MDTRSAGSVDIQTCIANCMRCHGFCLKSASHCLTLERDLAPVMTLLVCTDVCRVCADTLIRGSELHSIVCQACAQICARCAQECQGVENDRLPRECAGACRVCAECCAAMVAQAA